MTKRRNPRADEVPLQWKTHVGFKQIATKEEKEKLQGTRIHKINVALFFARRRAQNLHVWDFFYIAQTLEMMLKASSTLNNALNHQVANGYSDASHDPLQLKGAFQQKCYLCETTCFNLSMTEQCITCERCVCKSCAQKCDGCGYSCCFLCSTLE